MDKAVDIEKKLVLTIIFPKSAQKSLSSQINFYERNMEIHKTTINWIMSCSPVIFYYTNIKSLENLGDKTILMCSK